MRSYATMGGTASMSSPIASMRRCCTPLMVNLGHPEEDPEQELYSVRFESATGELGPPIGCWPEKLTDQP